MDIDCKDQGKDILGFGGDYLELRDGSLANSPIMGRLCGNGRNLPELIQSTQNYLRIRLNRIN